MEHCSLLTCFADKEKRKDTETYGIWGFFCENLMGNLLAICILNTIDENFKNPNVRVLWELTWQNFAHIEKILSQKGNKYFKLPVFSCLYFAFNPMPCFSFHITIKRPVNNILAHFFHANT